MGASGNRAPTPAPLTLPGRELSLSDGTRLYLDLRLTAELVDFYRRHGERADAYGVWVNRHKRLKVFASLDVTPKWGALLHVSVSFPDTDPDWALVKAVKAGFFGDGADAMIVLPRAADYVNVHKHCFHLWQMPEGWGIR